MIYLVDDNKYGQMSDNYILTLESYPTYIKWLQVVSANDITIVKSNADCVLIHDSFIDNENKDMLVSMVKDSNIPFCIFSNGFTVTLFENKSIKEIKKDRMYNNLLAFINHFKVIGKIDFEILSLGKNPRIEKISIIQDRLISGTLFNHMDNFNYEVAFPSGSLEYIDLMDLVHLHDPSVDFSAFEDKYNSKETTAYIMRDIIVSIVKHIKQRYEE